jgi:hypothetical protein
VEKVVVCRWTGGSELPEEDIDGESVSRCRDVRQRI